MPKAEVTQHDNAPIFEVGKAYKKTDGTRQRILVQAIETTRGKTDDAEFNRHRYTAVNVERGDKLSIAESALLASVKEKPCRVTKAELAKYEITPEGNGATAPAAEPDQTTNGNVQQHEPEAARESESGEAVSYDLTQAGLWRQIDEMQTELADLRSFRDAIHEQWEHLELPAGVSLVAAVEGVLEAERHEADQKWQGRINELQEQLEEEDPARAKQRYRNEVSQAHEEMAGPRADIFVNKGMSTYQVGKFVFRALAANRVITVSYGEEMTEGE